MQAGFSVVYWFFMMVHAENLIHAGIINPHSLPACMLLRCKNMPCAGYLQIFYFTKGIIAILYNNN